MDAPDHNKTSPNIKSWTGKPEAGRINRRLGGKPESNTENGDDTKGARTKGWVNNRPIIKTAKKQTATSPGATDTEEQAQKLRAIKEEKGRQSIQILFATGQLHVSNSGAIQDGVVR